MSSSCDFNMYHRNKLDTQKFVLCVFDSIYVRVCAAAKSLQACPTLCDPIDGSLPGSPVSGILQARTLEWVAISFCNAWKWKVEVKSHSRVWLLATPWTAAHQAPPSMGFSKQEYWSGVPLPSPLWQSRKHKLIRGDRKISGFLGPRVKYGGTVKHKGNF